MTLGGEAIRYSGTPMACSVSEAGQEKGMLLVEMREKGNIAARETSLLPLRRIRIVRGTGGGADTGLRRLRAGGTDGSGLGRRGGIAGTAQKRAFPRLLEVVRVARTAAEEETIGTEQRPQTDPYALCRAFLGEIERQG